MDSGPNGQAGIQHQAAAWSTPHAHNAHGAPGAGLTANDGRHRDLVRETAQWPTPRSEDSESAGNHPGATDSLTGASSLWQTPASDSFRSRGGDRKDEQGLDQQDGKMQQMLTHQAKRFLPSHQAPETPTHGDESSQSAPTSRRQLNPRFVAWLMGWNPGWTSLEPLNSASLGTGWCPSVPVSPSAPSGDRWPTPDTQNARSGGAMRVEAKGKHAMSLHHVVEGWSHEAP